MFKTAISRLLVVLTSLVAIMGVAFVAAPSASAATPKAKAAAVPVTERWMGPWNCTFVDFRHWIPVKALVQSKTEVVKGRKVSYKRVVQLSWGGSEHPDRINAWEKRGSKEIYTGGLAGWNAGGKTSGFTPRFSPPWMVQGATRYVRAQFHRNVKPAIRSVCAVEGNIG